MFTEANIISIKSLSPRVKEFTIQPNSILQAIPGQFIILQWGKNQRSYSISGLNDSNQFQIIVALNENGVVSPQLFDLKPNDLIYISEAKGEFVLPSLITVTEICFICTGTGVAPFKWMIESLLEKDSKTKLTLIFGNRLQEDILYLDSFNQLQKKHSQFKFIPVLSQQNWTGTTGYVHKQYLNKYTINDSVIFYICGWQAMCSDARRNLKEMGFNRKQYKFEQYD